MSRFKKGDKVIINTLSYSGAKAVVVDVAPNGNTVKITGHLKESYLRIGSKVNVNDVFLQIDKNQQILDIIQDLK